MDCGRKYLPKLCPLIKWQKPLLNKPVLFVFFLWARWRQTCKVILSPSRKWEQRNHGCTKWKIKRGEIICFPPVTISWMAKLVCLWPKLKSLHLCWMEYRTKFHLVHNLLLMTNSVVQSPTIHLTVRINKLFLLSEEKMKRYDIWIILPHWIYLKIGLKLEVIMNTVILLWHVRT